MKITPQEAKYISGRTVIILLKSTGLTLVTISIWYLFRENIYQFFGIADPATAVIEPRREIIFFMPSILYGTLQGSILSRMIRQNSRIKSAIDTYNARIFLEERDRRMPRIIHTLMFFISAVTIGMASIYQYPNIKLALFTIGSFTFLSILAFFIAIEIDNPFRGASRIPPHRIPEGWMTMKIDDIVCGRVKHYGFSVSIHDDDSKTDAHNSNGARVMDEVPK